MKSCLTFLFICCTFYVNSQVTMSAETKVFWNHLVKYSGQNMEPAASDIQKLPIYKINGDWYLSLIGKISPNADWSELESLGAMRGSVIGDIATVKMPLNALSESALSSVFYYLEIPGKVSPDLDRVRFDVKADSIHHGLGLPMGYTGKDVVIGITDWGFDYTHPMFYDTLLQYSRVIAAWDQFKQSGDHPNGYNYGVEFDSLDELMSAGSDTSNIYSYNTHGTHVAGIAGGGGAGLQYRGMAPDAGFLFTTFLIDYASVIDGFVWMKSKADELNRRLVVNMSWGLYYLGTLDGNSLLSQAIDDLSADGVVFVSSAGNNGDATFHIKKTFDNDSFVSRIVFDSYANIPTMWGQSVTMWGEVGEEFSISISLYQNSATTLVQSPVYSTNTEQFFLDSMLVTGNDTVWFELTREAQHPINNRPYMRLKVRNTDQIIKVALNAAAESGTVHFWNLIELVTGVGNWGLPFLTVGTAGLGGDANYSIGEPACTQSVISVGAYTSSYINPAGSLAGGQLADFTSIGPIMTEVMKPDISAPGVSVASSISSFTDASYSQVNTLTFNDVEYDFARFSGTSMSSPCVAGIVALMLDANPYLSAQQVKEILQTTARQDNFTGVITTPGHPRWGYGKVNGYAAVLLSLATIGTNVSEIVQTFSAGIMPNPANDNFRIVCDGIELISDVKMFDLSGKIFNLKCTKGIVDCSTLAAGVYVLQLQQADAIGYTKVVVE